MNLRTDVQLAEAFELSIEEFHRLRRYHRWPCVKFGRNQWRFTESQVEQIVARHMGHSARPRKVAGQTAASKQRSA